ncbi:E3 ubiquitin-protein ligase DZIP3-like [Montipora capricornis]|uniref:E3 ubiquitin-protein ligase DZIP3-like n=1 Tax=Montipora capricornis TaxID=246305 RepID=UPI0035F1F9D0
MATPGPLASSKEKTNGAKLSRLIIDGGTTVLRNVFDTHHPPANLAADLNSCYSILNNLLRRRILNGHQWDKLFPAGGAAPDSNTFDITLCFLLLTNICGLTPPHTGWHCKPPPSDSSHEANLARIKFFRNQLYGHITTTGVNELMYNALWQEISAVLVSLGLSQAEVDRLKAERYGEEDYLDALRDWAESERDLKTQLNEVRQLQNTIQESVEENKSILKDLRVQQSTTQQTVEKVYSRLENLQISQT